MSSKFNPAVTKRAPPPQCHKSPVPPILPIPIALAERIFGYAVWVDMDPLAYIVMSPSLSLTKQPGTNTYYGCAPKTGHRLCATVTINATATSANVKLHAYDPWRNPETIDMGTITIDPDKPFDTGLLTYTHLPRYDYRYCRFRE